MNRIGAALIATAMLVFAGSPQARTHPVHVAEAACPAGAPVQTITVVNQANVRPAALALVENAVVAQSLQVRAAWGTPCVVFGPGGWKLYLKTGGAGEPGASTSPVADSRICSSGPGALTFQGWSTDFSHEIVETLVDP